MELAPIVLFTYNRPIHTQQVLDSLASNSESKDSLLFIYCDGAKGSADKQCLSSIEETRKVAFREQRFKKVFVIEQPENKGLANSIIEGVTNVVNQYGNVIVLEDDLILSPYFLCYMNDSLERYRDDLNVGQIGGCNFFACGSAFPKTFFIPISDCLGWATWKDRWKAFTPDGGYLLNQLKNQDIIHKFNAYGSYDMEGMLKNQIAGKVSSWAIRWQAVCVINNWLTLYPNPSVTNHIESSNATHANLNIIPPLIATRPRLKTVEVKELDVVIQAMKLGYSGSGDYYGKSINKQQVPVRRFVAKFWRKLRNKLISE